MNNRWFQKRPLFIPLKKAAPKLKLKKKGGLAPFLWKGLKRLCTALGALVLIMMVISMISSAVLLKHTESKPLPKEMVLFWKVKGDLAENPQNRFNYAASIGGQRNTLRGVINALDIAREDERVKGFVTALNYGGLPLAQIYELRAAVKRFRESGKFAYIYAPSYGDLGSGLGAYYLASAFGEIWMQPMGNVAITGVYIESPYGRAALDRIGVQPQFEGRKEYKTVFENFTDAQMSDKSREMLGSLVDDLAAQMVAEISADRGIDAARFTAMVNEYGLVRSDEAKALGLVDLVEYGDVLVRRINKEAVGEEEPEESAFVDLGQYLQKESGARLNKGKHRKKSGHDRKPQVALIFFEGTLVSFDNRSGHALMGEATTAASDIAGAILDAADDEDIKAVVLRINSPGGAPVAAETIRRALIRAQEKGKIVVVSMGAMAASAGYWVAAPADTIFATPVTLTGSIGVAGGKFSLEQMWDKGSINWDSVKWGAMADMWTMNMPFSPEAHARFGAMMDSTYDAFISRVAEDRQMSADKVEAIAKGRAWTGRQGLERGLVDEIGGLSDALDFTAQMLERKDRFDLGITILPYPKTPLEQLIELLEMQSKIGQVINSQAALAGMLRPWLDAYEAGRDPMAYMTYAPYEVK